MDTCFILLLCCPIRFLYAVPHAFRRVFRRFRTPACHHTSPHVCPWRIRSQERPPRRRSRSPPVTPCHLKFRITYKYIAYIIYMHILKICYTFLNLAKTLSGTQKRKR